jgi:hypothetical protein
MVPALPKVSENLDTVSDLFVSNPWSSSSSLKIPVFGKNPAALDTL